MDTMRGKKQVNINLNITLWQIFALIVLICALVAYFVGDTHPVIESVEVPMVDPNISHHDPEDIPQLDEDGL